MARRRSRIRLAETPRTWVRTMARGLLQLERSTYRDFRPHAQLAAALFSGVRAWPSVPRKRPTTCSSGSVCRARPKSWRPTGSTLFPDGGYALLVKNDLRAFVRLPVFRFRPEPLGHPPRGRLVEGREHRPRRRHVLVQHDPEWMAYFPGVASHSTVQFCESRPDAPTLPLPVRPLARARATRLRRGRERGGLRVPRLSGRATLAAGHHRRLDRSSEATSSTRARRGDGGVALAAACRAPGESRRTAVADGSCRIVFDNGGDGYAGSRLRVSQLRPDGRRGGRGAGRAIAFPMRTVANDVWLNGCALLYFPPALFHPRRVDRHALL